MKKTAVTRLVNTTWDAWKECAQTNEKSMIMMCEEETGIEIRNGDGCSKGSKEDPEMVRVTFWTGSRQAWRGTSLCLCKECRRELYEKI